MLGIPLGLLTANGVEWAMHKYVLHQMGKKRSSFWSFHSHEHHREVRQHGYYDPNYEKFPLGLHAQGKETWSLIASSVLISPLFPVMPFYVGTLWYCALNYYLVHKRSHMDPEWGAANVPWHYDHHMGNNPGANWCVTKPWFDYLMGTREFSGLTPPETNVLGLRTLPKALQKAFAVPVKLKKPLRGAGARTP